MAQKNSEFANYRHHVPAVPTDQQWPEGYQFLLVSDISQLIELRDLSRRNVAFDTETTGLDPEKDQIVGVSLSFNGNTGFYIPINHSNKDASLGKEALDIVYEILKAASNVFMFNMRFDCRMMEYAGYDMSCIGKVFDVSSFVFNADSNIKMPSLKWSAKHFLGWEMQTFTSVTKGSLNFYYVEPVDATFYAASDALATYKIATVTSIYYKEARVSGQVDNDFLYPLMKCEEETTRMDPSRLIKIQQGLEKEMETLKNEIFLEVGYEFNLTSRAQLAAALKKLKINTGQKTSTGQMATGKDILSDLAEKYPICKKIVQYQLCAKAISSYTTPLLKECAERNDRIRFAYITNNAPTGRLAGGGDKKNSYFSGINIQSITKPHAQDYYCKYIAHLQGDEREEFLRTWDLTEDDVILNWAFSPNPEFSDYKIEGMEKKNNIRDAFLPEEGHYWVAIDFSGEELRLPTNFSKEPTWMKAFLSGSDIHKETALKVFGEENYDKNMRKLAKIVNFSIIYGATPRTISARTGMSLEESQTFYNKYKSAVPTLFNWMGYVIRKAKAEGTVYTYFGRPRRVRWYLSHSERKIRSFGERTAVNTMIQGTAADIIKYTILKLWKMVLGKPEYRKDVAFRSTIHDEVDFSVSKHRVVEIARKLEKIMEIRDIPEWKVPMEVEVSIGTSWGWMFAFQWCAEKETYIPKYENK
jgi:DNA polymerase-1